MGEPDKCTDAIWQAIGPLDAVRQRDSRSTRREASDTVRQLVRINAQCLQLISQGCNAVLEVRIESAKNCAALTGMLRSLHERNVVVECAWRCGNRIAYVVRPSELLAEHESRKAPTRRIGCHCLESDVTHEATP